MKTVLYAKGFKHIEEKLKNDIDTQIPDVEIKSLNSIESLSKVLRQPLNRIAVVVLVVSEVEELVLFNSMKKLFDNLRVILILPDRNRDTLGSSLKFKTSFISFIDSNLQDITSVLSQILKRQREVK